MPESADECFYFTRRTMDNDGRAIAWVLKPDCPKCAKAKMGKPIDKKTGDVRIRAKEYECPECGYSVGKEEFEPTLTMNVQYTCPFCKSSGEVGTPYKRKKFQGVDAYVFTCQKCGKQIPLTKKMKDVKEKN